jgi:hypothetical protein
MNRYNECNLFCGLVYPFLQVFWMQVRWMSRFTIWILDAALVFDPVTNLGRLRSLQPICVYKSRDLVQIRQCRPRRSPATLKMSCYKTNLGKNGFECSRIRKKSCMSRLTRNSAKNLTRLTPINLYIKTRYGPRKYRTEKQQIQSITTVKESRYTHTLHAQANWFAAVATFIRSSVYTKFSGY